MNFRQALGSAAFLIWVSTRLVGQDPLWLSEHGRIEFSSDAPLEIIRAKSEYLKGVVNTVTRDFAFTMNINSFEGFNSDIQQTHFLENYLEQKKYPRATFTGKLIEDIPFDKPGVYPVRAKGTLDIHGVKKERIRKGTITVNGGGGKVQTQFSIPVADHGISIPRIVQQKIADQIQVSVDIEFTAAAR